jgi:hypothetical protein
MFWRIASTVFGTLLWKHETSVQRTLINKRKKLIVVYPNVAVGNLADEVEFIGDGDVIFFNQIKIEPDKVLSD